MEKTTLLETIDRLLVLQDRDVRVARCQQELSDIPARQQMIASKLDQAGAILDQAKEALKSKQSAIKQIEIDIETHRAQIIKLREQQFQIKSNEEYRVLNNEIGHIQSKIKDLEDRELVVMEDLESVQREQEELKQKMGQDQSAIQNEVKSLEQRRQSIEQELLELQNGREPLCQNIDPEWLARYLLVMENKKDVALVSVDNNVCGGCHMRLPAQVIHDAKRVEEIVTCDFCGRMLYWRS